MARILLASAGDAAAVVGQPWFVVLCMAVASVLIVSFAVFLCGHSSGVHDEDLPKKKPTKPSSTKVRSMAGRSGTVVDTTGVHSTRMHRSTPRATTARSCGAPLSRSQYAVMWQDPSTLVMDGLARSHVQDLGIPTVDGHV
ncbi:hypothetical protein E2562_024927 [Oryza meyeriana var. granulata]|uniref:Uncharacterized protein n=1 Tax=Oryza meyeriana var. granulata TaxID=110450 RepID=A0A6G1DNR3_9ORYZ|nr:hypothetical protein E2562_024927 [Oryza meyeriana var. granulata]